jgi:phenylalanyl-tRNA synthetase beta chain
MNFESSVGLLDVETLKNRWEIDDLVLAGSILFKPDLFERTVKRSRYHEISNQPASVKDLALIVEQSLFAEQVQKDIARFAKKTVQGFSCEEVRVFDVYEGEGLPKDKKSLAVTMSFRAADRTLKDKEVNAAFDSIQKLITESTDYQIRK